MIFRLPIPWLLHFIIHGLSHMSLVPVSVSSKGLICSVGMLFIMLFVLIIAIAISGWRMNKLFGIIMIVSYILLCLFSIFLEMNIIRCPLRIENSC